jgi:hypothetical protein
MQSMRRCDDLEMSEGKLAAFAAQTPRGFTPLLDESGRPWYAELSHFAGMSPSDRAKLTIIGRVH